MDDAEDDAADNADDDADDDAGNEEAADPGKKRRRRSGCLRQQALKAEVDDTDENVAASAASA